MVDNKFNLAKHLDEQNLITVYGLPIDGMSSDAPQSFGWPAGGPSQFVMIHGSKLGDLCIKCRPFLVLLPTAGETLQKPECTFEPPMRKWSVRHDLSTIAMSPQVTTIGESLAAVSRPRGVSGGLQISNVTLQGTQVCGDIHYWGKIDFDELFIHIHEHFDQTRHVCINLINTWITIYSFNIGVASVALEATYRPHQLCARIHLSVPYGIWNGYLPSESGECASVPFAATATDCGCK